MSDQLDGFKKLNKENLSDQIIKQIKEMIENGILKPEDRLPSERELALKLGVSRLPLREALKTLQFINVLEVRQGEGYVVKGLDRIKLLDILEEACEPAQDTLNDLMEIRATLEMKAVELACSRRTEKDLARMLAAIEDMERNIDSEDQEINASIEFHNAVMKASHNKLFVAIMACFSDILIEGRMQTWRVKDRYKRAIEEHRIIYDAIKKRDVKAAVECMEKHVTTDLYRTDEE
ncbi:MAG: FadR/GntR family transcriptional regulator [Clostridia bacterium]|nr:FadR/GntR family transcriptional regulator [Clostridia bacterium]